MHFSLHYFGLSLIYPFTVSLWNHSCRKPFYRTCEVNLFNVYFLHCGKFLFLFLVFSSHFGCYIDLDLVLVLVLVFY